MMEGKVRVALRLIAEDDTGGPLQLYSVIEHGDRNYHPRDSSRNPLEKVSTQATNETIVCHHSGPQDHRPPPGSVQ